MTSEKRIGLLVAMRSEAGGWLNHIRVEKRWNDEGIFGWEGIFGAQKILLLQAGIGKERAEKAAVLACEKYTLSGLISIGYGGGLTGRLKAGDLILCRSLLSSASSETGMRVNSEASFLEAGQSMENCGIPILMGTCISAEKVITNSAEKKALNQLYGADAVDMESYWIGKACREKGTPFLAVRAISDTVDQRVWDAGDLNSSLDRVVWHAISDLLAHPGEISSLLTLVRNLRLAQRHITHFLDCLLRTEFLERRSE